MNDVPTPAPTTIRNLRIGIIAATLITGLLVLYVVNYYPRTDTAVVFANYIGMAPQVDGPITHFYVRDNQLVKAGDLLFEIDDRPYGYALERAKSDQQMLEGQIVDLSRTIASQESGVSVSQANTHSAQADLSRFAAAVDEAKADVANSQQGVERAKAQWTYANNNLHRVEPLLAKQFVAADQVDLARTQEVAQAQALKQAQSQLKLSEARLLSAQAQYERAKSDILQSNAQFEQSRHAVSTMEPLTAQRGARESAVQTAQYNFDNTKVRAPFDARVTNLILSEGAYAHTGQQVFTMIDARNWWAMDKFRETQLKHIAPGMKADVYVLSRPTVRLEGIVDSIGYGVTPDSDVISNLGTGLPDVQRTLNWVHLASGLPSTSPHHRQSGRLFASWRIGGHRHSRILIVATLVTAPVAEQSRSVWFWQFLRDELEPYPQRTQLVGRMVLTATLVMLICMAFRVPYAFQGPVLALFISRENTRATLNSVLTMCIGLTAGAVFVLVSAMFFTTDPLPHFLWAAGALFLVFFALSTVNNYIGVLMFSVLIGVGLPIWDRPVPVHVSVEDTLWLLWVGVLGAGVAFLVRDCLRASGAG